MQGLIHLIQLWKVILLLQKLMIYLIQLLTLVLLLQKLKLVNFQTSLGNLKTRVDDIDGRKLKNILIDWKKSVDAKDEIVVKNAKFSKLNTKVNRLNQNISDLSNQYNTDKQNLQKSIDEVENKITDVSGLVTTALLNTKLGRIDNTTTADLDTKIGEVENKIPDIIDLVKKEKEFMTLISQISMENISLLLIMINLRVKKLMQI